MANFCLPPKDADKFTKALASGEINPDKLVDMTSKERHALFADMFGEASAKEVNRLLESKLLLKNQRNGLANWARRMMGQNKVAQRDVISKIQNMKEILTPENEGKFLNELAEYKLGTRVTYDEAKRIADLSEKIDTTKEAMQNGGDRMEYGRAVVALREYVGDLTRSAEKFSLEEAKREPLKAVGKGISAVAGNTKAIKASMDNSAIFRQGWKTLLTNPDIWQKNARQSFVDLVKAFGSDKVMSEVNADIVSRPNYDLMRQAKLAIGEGEEAFPTSLPEKIPVLGNAYRATEHAYNAFVRRTRADVFDKYIDIAKKTGVDLNKDELQSIGKLVNSLTGRGNLGALEPVANVVNNVFFSPRMLKAHIDTLTQPVTGAGGSSFVRKQAALNLVKIVGGTAIILATARALKKDSVELDPRSSDFGKIKIGHTRFDVTGGMGSVLTLGARLLPLLAGQTAYSKSSTTGKLNELNSEKFGAQSGMDVFESFAENKLSPLASVIKDLAKGKTFSGEKPSLKNEAENLLVPLPITTFQELKNDPKSAPILAGLISDALGIATNTYGPGLGGMDKTLHPKVIDELDKAGVSLSVSPQSKGETDEEFRKRKLVSPGAHRKVAETTDQWKSRLEREARAINQAVLAEMTRSAYKKADDDTKRELLRKQVSAARAKIK